MGSVNKVILVGNLGRDAELRYTPGGAAVTTANMATTEVWTDRNGQRQERTEWMRVTIWGKQAESLQEYLTKGKQIYVEGRLQTRKAPRCRSCDAFLPGEWKANQDEIRCTKCGQTQRPYAETMLDVKADRVVLLSGGGRAAGADRGGAMDRGGSFERTTVPLAAGGMDEAPMEPITDDDIPF
ncbi:MAG TPA: single-stranded DNA-binding protein [Vicinamibacterales bacterium]|jgi:primosomal replication protein N|nr:single-stranded DNA-binding protein [Vicinamibacterales bacterium]